MSDMIVVELMLFIIRCVCRIRTNDVSVISEIHLNLLHNTCAEQFSAYLHSVLLLV